MLKKEKYDGFFGGLYKRNEKFLILSTAILLISVFLGFALASVLSPILGVMFGEFKRKAVQGQIQLTTLSIFLNNIRVSLFIYLGGPYFWNCNSTIPSNQWFIHWLCRKHNFH